MVGRRRRLVLGAALAPVAVCGADGFAACERVRVDSAEDVRRFWEAYSADPRPALLISDSVKPVDFLGDGGLEPDEGVEVEDVSVGGAAHAAYILTNAAYTPRVFDKLAAEFPLPAAVESIALRPVFSIGRNGTGERDLAHHYHPITAMRLLQGRTQAGERARSRLASSEPLQLLCAFLALWLARRRAARRMLQGAAKGCV